MLKSLHPTNWLLFLPLVGRTIRTDETLGMNYIFKFNFTINQITFDRNNKIAHREVACL